MKSWVTEKFRGNEKIISAALTVPIIAAGTMSGACAAGCPYGLVNDPYPWTMLPIYRCYWRWYM